VFWLIDRRSISLTLTLAVRAKAPSRLGQCSRISVGDSKTEAGVRLVDILPALRDELTSHRHAAANPSPTTPHLERHRRDKDNARERVIRPVVAAADELLARSKHDALPAGVTAYAMRRDEDDMSQGP
jgi:hypothetical protein